MLLSSNLKTKIALIVVEIDVEGWWLKETISRDDSQHGCRLAIQNGNAEFRVARRVKLYAHTSPQRYLQESKQRAHQE